MEIEKKILKEPIQNVKNFKITDKWQIFNSKGSKLKGIFDIGGKIATLAIYKGVDGELFDWHYHDFSESVTAVGNVVYFLGEVQELEDGRFQVITTKKILLKAGDCLKIPEGVIHKALFLDNEGIVLVWCPALGQDGWSAEYKEREDITPEQRIDIIYDNLEIMAYDFALKEQLLTDLFFSPYRLNCILTFDGFFKYYSPLWLEMTKLDAATFDSTPFMDMIADREKTFILKFWESDSSKDNVITKYKIFNEDKKHTGDYFYVDWERSSTSIGGEYWICNNTPSTEEKYKEFKAKYKNLI